MRDRRTPSHLARLFLSAPLAAWILLPVVLARAGSTAGAPPQRPNADPVYQQLRQVALGSESVSVHDLVLRRDAGAFTLSTGKVCFLAPVNGKVTGAVFEGQGSFSLEPPTAEEKRSLSYLTKGPRIDERFRQLLLRFTDDSYREIKSSPGAGTAAAGGCSSDALRDARDGLRHHLHYNLDARILQDVDREGPGGLFVAFIHGEKYSDKLVYVIDPHGAPFGVEPDEVALRTYADDKYGTWAAFHLSSEYATGKASSDEDPATVQITDQHLETRIESNGKLHGKATATFLSRMAGLRVVPFDLFPTLRIKSVTSADGQPLSFIQEDKNDDPDFWVILPKPLPAGAQFVLTTVYSGKDAVRDEGGGNYYPVARDDWYPRDSRSHWANYEMSFAVPKGMSLVATGVRVSSPAKEEAESVSRWRSEFPEQVAGFQFGSFKEETEKIAQLNQFEVDSFANKQLPNVIESLRQAAEGPMALQPSAPQYTLGSMSTTGMAKKAMAEAIFSVQLYSDYFGQLPFTRLAMTQQTAFNYGQSWPEMIYLPISYFYDSTIRHQLHLEDPRGYFKIVGPHEVAHQWWGHTVGWASYRDQWISEGFAEFSASLFLQYVWKKHEETQKFWNDELDLLTERNKEGFRPIDVGPLTLGYRLNNSKTGFDIYRRLIYPKGAYVLHMIRMMMWDPKTGDENFKAMMHDFVNTYRGRGTATEDFKAMVEKHMTPQMNLAGNGNMDWFFNEYVYGTALPAYAFDSTFSREANGTVVAHFKLTQSGVDDTFAMLVPIYLELGNGRVAHLGRIRILGNSTWEQKVPLAGLKEIPKRAMINYQSDVLCSK